MSQGKSTQPKIKIVVLGMHSAGKTTLVDRLIHERFLGPMGATVGAAYNSFELALDKNRKLTLAIWDTAGAERFESMTKSYYKDAEGALLCFDVTDANSWNKVKFWAQELQAVEESTFEWCASGRFFPPQLSTVLSPYFFVPLPCLILSHPPDLPSTHICRLRLGDCGHQG